MRETAFASRRRLRFSAGVVIRCPRSSPSDVTAGAAMLRSTPTTSSGVMGAVRTGGSARVRALADPAHEDDESAMAAITSPDAGRQAAMRAAADRVLSAELQEDGPAV